MEDETYHVRPFMATSSEYAIEMEPESPRHSNDIPHRKNSTQVDVCYPYEPQLLDQHSTIETDVLNAYLEKDDEIADPEFKTERQMSAKLDDLLENSNEKASMSRRYSLYGEIIKVSYYFYISSIFIILTISIIGSIRSK